MVPADRHARTDQRENPDKIDPALTAEPIDKAEASEPTEAIERMDPAEPMDKIDPAEPMDKIDPAEPNDKIDPAEPMTAASERSRPGAVRHLWSSWGHSPRTSRPASCWESPTRPVRGGSGDPGLAWRGG